MRKITLALVVVCIGVLLCGGCQRLGASSMVTTLQCIRVEYFDDGAGGCVPELAHESEVKLLLQRPEVGEELINHLDSRVMTKSTFEGQSIPLGYLCLDILLKSVREDYYLAVYTGGSDDGLWANVREEYYFRPDVLRRRQGHAKMASVRAAWQKLYKETNARIWDTSKHTVIQ